MNINLINPALITKNPMLKLCKQIHDLTDGMCQVGAGPNGFGIENNRNAEFGFVIASHPRMVKNNCIIPDDVDGYTVWVEGFSIAEGRSLKPAEIANIKSESTDANTLKLCNAWQTLWGYSKYISKAECRAAFNALADLQCGHEEAFYCPVDVCHFPGMTYKEFNDLDNGYEEWFLQDYRIQDTAFLRDDVATNFVNWPKIKKIMAHYKYDFPDILPHVSAAHFDFVEKNGQLWLNTAFALKERVDTERLREFAAQSISDFAMQGRSIQKDEGLYLISIEPYRTYNQNTLLTEDELQSLPSEDKDIGMGGIN